MNICATYLPFLTHRTSIRIEIRTANSEEGCVWGSFYMRYGDAYYVIQKKSPAKNFPHMTSLAKISRKWPHCLANGVHVIGACFTDDTKRKHPMSKCVSKSDSFYMIWHPLSPFSHNQSFGVPMTSLVFPACGITTGNTHNMFQLALMTSA